jgi:hypothetical protein
VTVASTIDSIRTSVDQVNGLRAPTTAGKVTPPAAVVELDGITTPSVMGGTFDGQIRVLLLVQVGDFRNVTDRILTLVEPEGTVTDSVVVALLSNDQVGQVSFEGPGLLDYGGQTYGGGVLTCSVIG